MCSCVGPDDSMCMSWIRWSIFHSVNKHMIVLSKKKTYTIPLTEEMLVSPITYYALRANSISSRVEIYIAQALV
jgi:hypothetical protein